MKGIPSIHSCIREIVTVGHSSKEKSEIVYRGEEFVKMANASMLDTMQDSYVLTGSLAYEDPKENRLVYALDSENVQSQNQFYQTVKRFQDVVLSSIALVLLFPFMLITALVIWIECPNASPIFVQDRVGKDGKVFRFYKFRSMVPNAEAKLQEVLNQNEMDGPVFKIKNDPRITHFGRFIRKTSIDELPQLFNVLRGDMSIVGPRPALPREVAQYTDYERQRLLVTPGLTCYWQVQPNRNALSFDAWLALDLKYIQERSFLVDWKIIWKTVSVVFKMYGQ